MADRADDSSRRRDRHVARSESRADLSEPMDDLCSDPIDHLTSVDPVMRRLIEQIGPFSLKPKMRRSPFESLARAIAYQQLHDKAAESILKRFVGLFPGRRFPRPDDLLAMDVKAIRQAGFSRSKIMALRDLAQKTIDGTVPTNRMMQQLDDEAIIQRLIDVRGIGRWTVEMLRIFQLERPDVLPVHDFGVRNGFRIGYRRATMPTPRQVWQHGERWRPFRTAAAWYLWRAADREKRAMKVF